jgi:type II secretory pathway pseudopilin PulG
MRGFSFVELLVTAAVVTMVFTGLVAGVQLMVKILGDSKAQSGATALAVERLEYLRSLTYNDLGTDGGVPAGLVPQTRTMALNDITYYERVIIEYVDDAADGFGGVDSNGILSDYKRIKVEYSWDNDGATSTVAVVSTVVPPGIETTAGGGSIRVNVFDAATGPVSGASVRFQNDTTTSTIDTSRLTDPNGQVLLSGAPAAANYEITVTKGGYSTDGTYVASSSNPNPATPPIAVVESAVSTMNFQIDLLSDLTIETVGLPSFGTFSDTFADDTLVASYASTTRVDGAIELVPDGGGFAAAGTVLATSTSPSPLERWYQAWWTSSTTASTSLAISLYYDTGSGLALVPDGDLPGNSTGFTASPVSLEALSVSTYDTLALGATLTTSDTNQTPALLDWELEHVASEPDLNGIPLSLQGDKTIGTDTGGQPVYKFSQSGTTDGNGVWSLPDTEFDVYTLTLDTGSYDVYEVCPHTPFALAPGITETVRVTLGSNAAAFLRVAVVDTGGTPIANASVRLQNTGVDETKTTSLCGQAAFASGLYEATDYTLTVSAPGFTSSVLTDVAISTSSVLSVPLGS